MNYHYTDSNNQVLGPVAEEELHALYQSGVITSDTDVHPEGGSSWQKYSATALRARSSVPLAPTNRTTVRKFANLQVSLLGLILAILLGWSVYFYIQAQAKNELIRKIKDNGDSLARLALARNIMTACKLYAADHTRKYPMNLNMLVKESELDSNTPSSEKIKGAPDADYEYFGDRMTDSDSGDWILLMSNWRDSKGRRVVGHNDGGVLLEIPEAEKIPSARGHSPS